MNITIDIEVLKNLKLTLNEYAVLTYIEKLQSDPKSGMDGWCVAFKKDIAEALNLSKVSVFTILNKLVKKGLIERHSSTKFIRTSEKWFEITFFTPSKDSLPRVKLVDLKEKVAQKENNINILFPTERAGVSPKRGTPCPLNNPNNPLKAKWPRGHVECAEYVTAYKFVNKAKQFEYLHKMLRAGLDFPDIDKLAGRITKKSFYQDNGWDFATLASEADRRINANT